MITIDGYAIDVALSETHEYESETTSFPVEDGANITDHIRTMPIVVTLECVVSNTPIGRALIERAGVQALIDNGLVEPTTPAGDALTKLLAVRAARRPVTIVTGLKVYENMVMESLSIPRDASGGDALRFSATFREIVIVTNQRTRVRVAVPRGAKRKNLGNKTANVFAGPGTYRCLHDKTAYVKPEDVAAAKASASSATDAVWTDYRNVPMGPTTTSLGDYTAKVRICVRKDRVGYDSTANGGRGVFLKSDGKTPMSQEELDDYNHQLERESNLEYGPNMQGPVRDLKSNQYVQYIDRPLPKAPNSAEPSKPWWYPNQALGQ